MKKEVIIVPKEKCPLDVLAQMGEKTKNSWIFLNENAIKHLRETADTRRSNNLVLEELVWEETEKYPETLLIFEKKLGTWVKVYRICATDIAFSVVPEDPEEIFFLKMEE